MLWGFQLHAARELCGCGFHGHLRRINVDVLAQKSRRWADHILNQESRGSQGDNSNASCHMRIVVVFEIFGNLENLGDPAFGQQICTWKTV